MNLDGSFNLADANFLVSQPSKKSHKEKFFFWGTDRQF
jgi:hypothetical protein